MNRVIEVSQLRFDTIIDRKFLFNGQDKPSNICGRVFMLAKS
jgi:hypothetical protein